MRGVSSAPSTVLPFLIAALLIQAGSADAAEPDFFTVVSITDTQTNPDAYEYAFDWVAENKDTLNIKALVFSGDHTMGSRRSWENFRDKLEQVEAADVPHIHCLGNHDLGGPVCQGYQCLYRYEDWRDKPWFGGTALTYQISDNCCPRDEWYHTMTRYWITFEHGNDQYVVLTQPFTGSDHSWINETLAEYPEHRVILTTHAGPGIFGGWSAELWQQIKHQANLFMILSGHAHTPGRRDLLGTAGNTVYSLCNAYTHYSDNNYHGGFYIRLFKFVPAEDRIYVRTYNPWLDQDFPGNNERDHFVLDYDMTGGRGAYDPEDLNQDGVVNFDDLLMLLDAWGACGVECPADLNSDGRVSTPDLFILISAWG